MTNFLSEQINSFSRKLYFIEHGTLHRAAENLHRKPNVSLYRRNDIRNFEIFVPDLYCNIMLLLFSISSWRWQLIINDLINFFKSIFNILFFLNLADKIVFQFRKRCTLPTYAMGHHARDCWRRYSAGAFSSACSVYAIWTALKNFSLKIQLVSSISFLSSVKIFYQLSYFNEMNATIIFFKMTRL